MTRDSADSYIRANYRTMTAPAIAAVLGIGWTDARVRVRAQRIGIAHKKSGKVRSESVAGRRREPIKQHQWTPLERRQLTELHLMGESITTIAREIGVAPVHVRREIEIRTDPMLRVPVPVPSRPIAEVRRTLESRLHEHAMTANGIRCVCGRPGAPVHCERHNTLVHGRLS
mgnify:CR=1 FL=1